MALYFLFKDLQINEKTNELREKLHKFQAKELFVLGFFKDSLGIL